MISLTKHFTRERTGTHHVMALRALIKRAASWWFDELLNILPAALAERLSGRATRVVYIQPLDGGVCIKPTAGHERQTHDRFIHWNSYSAADFERQLKILNSDRADTALALLLPSDRFFYRTFDIPSGARERLDAIALQELEHRTPFRAGDVFFTTRTGSPHGNNDTLTAQQAIVRRDLVESALNRLQLPLDRIAFAAPEASDVAGSWLVPLHDRKNRRQTRLQHAIRHLAAAAAVLLAVNLLVIWWVREAAIADLEAKIVGVQQKARVVREIEQEIAGVQTALNSLAARRALPSTAELLNQTSRTLPDNSWVTDWRFGNGAVSLSGFSSAATSLVELFERAPPFREARLTAPIAFDSVHGRDRFSLTAQVSGGKPTRSNVVPR